MKPFLLLSLLVVLLGPAPPALSQSPGEISYVDHSVMPDGPLGDMISELLATINANDAAAIANFINERCAASFRDIAPMETHVDVFLNTYHETGGLDFHSIRTYVPARPDETVIILKDRNYHAWRAIVLEYNTQSDEITSLQFATARTPSNVVEPAIGSDDQLVAHITTFMQRICDKGVFSGTVLVARGDDILFERACGEASKRFHVPNNIDTKFNLGSMNKMFTSTAILQLAERGKLSLDDAISMYVDTSWLPETITARVTVRHLLTHTSGLGSYFNETYWQSSRERFRKVSDYQPLVRGDFLRFEPGSDYRYSNTGMLLLGVVIESASGQDYFDYIRQHIYQPAGMRNTDCYAMDEPVENLAIGYIPNRSNGLGWENNIYKHVLMGGPAGGGFSTVRDLHKYARAMQQGKLVSASSREAMWTDHHGHAYGYGFSVEQGKAGRIVGHGGGFPGLNANLDIFTDAGLIVAVLSNHHRGASPVARYIYDLIHRMPS